MNRDARKIAGDLKRLGIRKGHTIFVHSSLKSFGWVEGGAETIIDALLAAVGPDGNVLLPTLTGSERLGPECPPVFDVRNTPCWVGAIPETFRKRPEARRSLHPTHSVACIGADTQALLDRHDLCPTPCGRRSPYYRMATRGGLIVLFGVNLERVTLMHTIEELAALPYHLQLEPVHATIINARGHTLKRTLYIHRYGDERNFSIMESVLREAGALWSGRVLQSETMIIRADALIEMTLERLRRNPRLLLKG